MANVSLYLNFHGATEAAFNFYRTVFGGEFGPLQRFRDTPGMEKLPEGDRGKIMHISLQITQNMTLHGTDTLDTMGRSLNMGNNMSVMLEVNSKDEAQKYYNALAAGGRDEMPLQETFWGAYFGSFTDKFGVPWMIDFEQNPQ